MYIHKHDLLVRATAYVNKEGILEKWRYDSNDLLDIDAVLNAKMYSKEKLTDGELNYIKKHDNVVIETDTYIQFINFSGAAMTR